MNVVSIALSSFALGMQFNMLIYLIVKLICDKKAERDDD